MKRGYLNKNILIAGMVLIIFIGVQSSCYYSKSSPGWEYMPDMTHSSAFETYAPNPNFPDSSNARIPVSGTIPRGIYMPFHYSPQPTGYDSAGNYLHFPDGFTQTDRVEGQRLFSIYCAVCHGLKGNGEGSITAVNTQLKNPFPNPPSYYDEAHINLPEGKEYYSVHYGKNLMGAYSKSLDQNQIWKVVYYVRSMQEHYADSIKTTGGTLAASGDTTKNKSASSPATKNGSSVKDSTKKK
ncbi:MAG: cytochrome c [Chitinophagales bacterium]|nr:cytochrome c [Chitinophagales bacterium]